MISFKQFCESSFAEIPGKQENRQMEFAMLRKKGILSQLSNRNTISVFSLPAEYAYELYLSKVTGKQIISFGTDYNLPNLVKNARIVAGTGKIIPFVTSTAANINKIIINPEAYSFYKVDPIRGHTSESVILPKDLDVIDLDYTRIPLSPSMNLGKKLGGNSFIYVTKAAQFLKPNGIICVTFLLEYRGSNYLTTTRDPEYQDLIKKHEIQPGEPFKAKPIKYHLKVNNLKSKIYSSPEERYATNAKIGNEYISQIWATSQDPEFNIPLRLVFHNMYQGKHNNNVMFRAVFQKA